MQSLGGKVGTKWSKHMETCMFVCFDVTFGVKIMFPCIYFI